MSIEIPSSSDAAFAAAPQQAAIEILSRLVRITTSLFGKEVKVVEDCDPEFPDDRYVVFAVDSDMEPADLLRAEQAWVREVRAIAPNWDSVRLSIRPH
jgi:hypothetical protein